MKTALIFGSSGLIGSELLNAVKKNNKPKTKIHKHFFIFITASYSI